SGRIFLHAALSRRSRFSPGRFERGSVEEPQRKHAAVFILENTLRTFAGRIRTAGERKRRATFSTLDCIGKSAGQLLLCPGRDARAQTRAETDQDRKRREGPALSI